MVAFWGALADGLGAFVFSLRADAAEQAHNSSRLL